MHIFHTRRNKWPFVNIIGCLVLVNYQNLVCANDQTCNVSPSSKARGLNKLDESNQSLVQLHFIQHSRHDGWIGQEEYKVRVFSTNSMIIDISSVKIIVESRGGCGTGSFKFERKDFTLSKVDNCPTVLESNVVEFSKESPSLIWSPPSCGCVRFRIIAMGMNNAFFMDDDGVDGPLSQTVCIENRVTRDHYMVALCNVVKVTGGSHVINTPSFLSRHGLNTQTMDRHPVQLALEYRRKFIFECCEKPNLEDRDECMGDIRRRRIDKLCGEQKVDGVPLVTFRAVHMRERERTCCRHLAEARYQCFGEKANITKETGVTFLDFSLDDTDPVNDLAIFVTSKDNEAVNVLRYVKFQAKTVKADQYGGLTKLQTTTKSVSTSHSAEKMAEDTRRKMLISGNEGKHTHGLYSRYGEETSVKRKGGAPESVEHDEEEFESSAEKIVKNLHSQVQLQKLRFISHCCGAGGRSGFHVVSRMLEQAVSECELIAKKYFSETVLDKEWI